MDELNTNETTEITEGIPAPTGNPNTDAPNLVADLIEKNTDTPAPAAEIDFLTLFPDKHGFDQAEIDKQVALFKSTGVSENAAKELISDRIAIRDSALKLGRDLHEQEIKDTWKATQSQAIELSKKVFGADFDSTMALVPQALNRFMDKEGADTFSQFLRESGLGNDHRFIAFMASVGKSVSDDLGSGGDGSPSIAKKVEYFPGSGLKV